jgi:hypothetical protein
VQAERLRICHRAENQTANLKITANLRFWWGLMTLAINSSRPGYDIATGRELNLLDFHTKGVSAAQPIK